MEAIYARTIIILFLFVPLAGAEDVISFTNRANAVSHLGEINSLKEMPVKGRNAKTNEKENTKGLTSTFSKVEQRYTDDAPVEEYYITKPDIEELPELPDGAAIKAKDESWEFDGD